jgi:hypothetical protein
VPGFGVDIDEAAAKKHPFPTSGLLGTGAPTGWHGCAAVTRAKQMRFVSGLLGARIHFQVADELDVVTLCFHRLTPRGAPDSI